MRKQNRYFALKLPLAVDAKTATFAYLDPGKETDTELRSWGAAGNPMNDACPVQRYEAAYPCSELFERRYRRMNSCAAANCNTHNSHQ